MANTSIEWTHKVWNPVTGCNKISAGCKFCYAETIAKRFWKKRKFTDMRFYKEKLQDPAKWKKPARIFVNSMSDLFHEKLSFQQIQSIFQVMLYDAPQHTYQVLTKRTELGKWFFDQLLMDDPKMYCDLQQAKHIWLGVSIENQEQFDKRMDDFFFFPTPVLWISAEPLIGQLDIITNVFPSALSQIKWVVVGGESGASARPMHSEWATDLRDQCKKYKIPFFFKQWGTWHNGSCPQKPKAKKIVMLNNGDSHLHIPGAAEKYYRESKTSGYGQLQPFIMTKTGKKLAGRLLEGREHNEYPQQ